MRFSFLKTKNQGWCPACGKRCDGHSNFCANCGTDLRQQESVPASESLPDFVESPPPTRLIGPPLLPLGCIAKNDRERNAAPFPLCTTAGEILACQEKARAAGLIIISRHQRPLILRKAEANESGAIIAESMDNQAKPLVLALSSKKAATGRRDSGLWVVNSDYPLLGSEQAVIQYDRDQKQAQKLSAVWETDTKRSSGFGEDMVPTTPESAKVRPTDWSLPSRSGIESETVSPTNDFVGPALLPLGYFAKKGIEREKYAAPFPRCRTTEEILACQEMARAAGFTVSGWNQRPLSLRPPRAGEEGVIVAESIDHRPKPLHLELPIEIAATGKKSSRLWVVSDKYPLLGSLAAMHRYDAEQAALNRNEVPGDGHAPASAIREATASPTRGEADSATVDGETRRTGTLRTHSITEPGRFVGPDLLPLGSFANNDREKNATPFPRCRTTEEILACQEKARAAGLTIIGWQQRPLTLRAPTASEKGVIVAESIDDREPPLILDLRVEIAATGARNSRLWVVNDEYPMLGSSAAVARYDAEYAARNGTSPRKLPTSGKITSPKPDRSSDPMRRITIWRLISHHADGERVVQMSRREGVIAIGWGGTGDLNQQRFGDASELTQVVAYSHPGSSSSNTANGGRSLWRLFYEMEIGDLVILNTGAGGSGRAATMRVTGNYFFRDDDLTLDYEHRRKAEAVPIDPNRLWALSGGAASGEGIRWTLLRCSNTLTRAECNAILRG